MPATGAMGGLAAVQSVITSAHRQWLALAGTRAYGAHKGHAGNPMLRFTDRVFEGDLAVGPRSASGFSLIELVVTIAVIAVLVGLAIPGFSSTINSNRLTTAANEMVGILQTARMEAVRQNRSITVCRSSDSATCADAGTSWIVRDADKVLRVGNFPPRVVASATINTFLFRADGLARQTATSGLLNTNFGFCINTTSPPQNSRTVSVGSGSRISTATPAGTASCP